jgi:hypothetical protein
MALDVNWKLWTLVAGITTFGLGVSVGIIVARKVFKDDGRIYFG